MTQLLDLILSLWFFQQGHEVVPRSQFAPSNCNIECNVQFSGKQIVNDPKTFQTPTKCVHPLLRFEF